MKRTILFLVCLCLNLLLCKTVSSQQNAEPEVCTKLSDQKILLNGAIENEIRKRIIAKQDSIQQRTDSALAATAAYAREAERAAGKLLNKYNEAMFENQKKEDKIVRKNKWILGEASAITILTAVIIVLL